MTEEEKPEELTPEQALEREIETLESEAWQAEKLASDFRNASRKASLLNDAKNKRHKAAELRKGQKK